MKAPLILAIAALCSGCATIEPSSTKAEAVWQGLNVLDTAQTLNIAKRPDCFSEINPVSHALVGSKPNVAQVLGLGLAYAWSHDRISGWLDRKVTDAIMADNNVGGWYTLRMGWHVVGLVGKVAAVTNNNAIGMRPMGAGCSR